MKQLWIVLFAALAACVLPSSGSGAYDTYAPSAQSASGGVYINGQLLTPAQEAELARLVGEQVPAGRYVLDEQGYFGLEGRSERVNLAAHIRARQGGASGDGSGTTMMHDRSDGSTMVGYDDCVSMTTPSGTFMGSGC